MRTVCTRKYSRGLKRRFLKRANGRWVAGQWGDLLQAVRCRSEPAWRPGRARQAPPWPAPVGSPPGRRPSACRVSAAGGVAGAKRHRTTLVRCPCKALSAIPGQRRCCEGPSHGDRAGHGPSRRLSQCVRAAILGDHNHRPPYLEVLPCCVVLEGLAAREQVGGGAGEGGGAVGLLPLGVQRQQADGGGELVGGICERRRSMGIWWGIPSLSTSTASTAVCCSARCTCNGTEQGLSPPSVCADQNFSCYSSKCVHACPPLPLPCRPPLPARLWPASPWQGPECYPPRICTAAWQPSAMGICSTRLPL